MKVCFYFELFCFATYDQHHLRRPFWCFKPIFINSKIFTIMKDLFKILVGSEEETFTLGEWAAAFVGVVGFLMLLGFAGWIDTMI